MRNVNSLERRMILDQFWAWNVDLSLPLNTLLLNTHKLHTNTLRNPMGITIFASIFTASGRSFIPLKIRVISTFEDLKTRPYMK